MYRFNTQKSSPKKPQNNFKTSHKAQKLIFQYSKSLQANPFKYLHVSPSSPLHRIHRCPKSPKLISKAAVGGLSRGSKLKCRMLWWLLEASESFNENCVDDAEWIRWWLKLGHYWFKYDWEIKKKKGKGKKYLSYKWNEH